MNCKPGDLAIIVKSMTGKNLGKIVRCIKISKLHGLTNPDGTLKHGVVWEIDKKYESWSGKFHNFCLDEDLRPIRDPGEDARDETLEWLPSPSKQKETA